LLHPVTMVSSDRVATASTGIYALRFILVQISLCSPGSAWSCTSLRGPATRGEKTPRCDCNWFQRTGKSLTKNKVRACPRGNRGPFI